MANALDELNPEVREEGLDTNVIMKKLPAKVGVGSKIFEIMLWGMGILPGVIFLFMKTNAQNPQNRSFTMNQTESLDSLRT